MVRSMSRRRGWERMMTLSWQKDNILLARFVIVLNLLLMVVAFVRIIGFIWLALLARFVFVLNVLIWSALLMGSAFMEAMQAGRSLRHNHGGSQLLTNM